jgi:hypothetical protein
MMVKAFLLPLIFITALPVTASAESYIYPDIDVETYSLDDHFADIQLATIGHHSDEDDTFKLQPNSGFGGVNYSLGLIGDMTNDDQRTDSSFATPQDENRFNHDTKKLDLGDALQPYIGIERSSNFMNGKLTLIPRIEGKWVLGVNLKWKM